MVGRGRPRSTRATTAIVVRVKLRLYPGEDDDLIVFFDAIPHRLRATMVKQTLRSGTLTANEESTAVDDDVFEALDSLID